VANPGIELGPPCWHGERVRTVSSVCHLPGPAARGVPPKAITPHARNSSECLQWKQTPQERFINPPSRSLIGNTPRIAQSVFHTQTSTSTSIVCPLIN
jgi:hypothetical protein